MANWRRGFFRLWVLLTVLWLILFCAIAVPSYLNPVLPDRYLTINDRAELETVEPFSDRYFTLAADTDKNFIRKVTVDDELAPEVFFFAPNDINVDFRGRTYRARVTTENLEPLGREGLIDTLMSYILTQETEPQDLIALRAEIAAAIPAELKPRWATREIGDRVKKYGFQLHRESLDATHRAQVTSFLIWGLLPPIIILMLGAALGWVLIGFRRKRTPAL